MTTPSEETAETAKIAEKIWLYLFCGLCVLGGSFFSSPVSAQPAGPVIVVETTKGTFEFETYPADAPKTVAHILELVKRGFYDGQRVHRALSGFLVQWGDPRSRDVSREADWGRGPDASSGHPIGASELRRKRLHTSGAVGVAHQGNPALADSQIYVTLANRPDLNNRYTVFGHVVDGDDVPGRLERGDLIRKVYVKQ